MRLNFPPLSDNVVADFLRDHFDLREQQVSILTRFASGSLYQVEALVEGDYLQIRQTALRMFESALAQEPWRVYAGSVRSSVLDSREKVEILLMHWQIFTRDLAWLCSVGSGERTAEPELIYHDLLTDYEKLVGNRPSFELMYSENESLETARLQLRRNAAPRMVALAFLMGLAKKQMSARH
jgi:hypothetical protein